MRQIACSRALLTLICCLTGALGPARAQPLPSADDEPVPVLDLKFSDMLAEHVSEAQRSSAPVFLLGDRISGRPDLETVVQGDAALRKSDTVIKADRMEYYQPDDRVKAEGSVRINRGGSIYQGEALDLRVDAFEGFMTRPTYEFLQTGANGAAQRVDFLGESHALIRDASYTTCRRQPGPNWMPDWVLHAATIDLDNDQEVGIASDAVLRFKGVPILPVPAISFPLTEKRKSGFLPPTIGVDNVNGVELTAPYYVNIAPNRDATLIPTLMTLRGIDLGTEFRYLEPNYSGNLRGNYMPADKLRDEDRWGVAFSHQGQLDIPLAMIGRATIAANLNRVSDDDYWRDFTGSNTALTQRLLPTDVTMNWVQQDFSNSLRVLKWQTLQDPLAPIVPPYDRVPQLTTHYAKSNLLGVDWAADADFTQFEANRILTLQPNAERGFVWLQASRPWLLPSGYITPKLQLHSAAYQFDQGLPTGERWSDSTVSTLSLDAGMVFERDTTILGSNLLQTLEPRAFYVNTPYHNQSVLPNYDTGLNDFNFASIYTENAFVGHDKISDNNLLTLGVSTRYLDGASGAQFAKFGIAQRFRFEDQLVTLNTETPPAKAGLSDVLLGASVNVNERWSGDSTIQYNPLTAQSVRSTVGARYNPGPFRVVNAAYRFQRDLSEQVDLSWQWPINASEDPYGAGGGRYYSVGRLNYSMDENRLVDTIVGVEYDAGCWLARLVLDRVQTSASSATERLMFQLEFVGFTKLGISPQKTLAQNIGRYQNLRDIGAAQSRFGNYD